MQNQHLRRLFVFCFLLALVFTPVFGIAAVGQLLRRFGRIVVVTECYRTWCGGGIVSAIGTAESLMVVVAVEWRGPFIPVVWPGMVEAIRYFRAAAAEAWHTDPCERVLRNSRMIWTRITVSTSKCTRCQIWFAKFEETDYA